MPSYLDLGLIAVMLISALLSMVRGFTREVLAIASWVAAALAALYFYPLAVPYLTPYIDKPQIAQAAAAAIVFFVALVIVSIITVKISDLILDSRVGALDRSLGFVFGAARGFLLCVVAFVFFAWLIQGREEPAWMAGSKTKPYLEATGQQLMALLPDDPESTLLKRLNPPAPGPTDEPAPDDAPPPAPATPPRPGQPL